MKNFKVGQIWATRNDSRAEIVAINLHEGTDVRAPIGAIVREPDSVWVTTFTVNGKLYSDGVETPYDLVYLVKEAP